MKANQITVPAEWHRDMAELRCTGCGAELEIRNYGHDGDSENQQHTVLDCLQHLAVTRCAISRL